MKCRRFQGKLIKNSDKRLYLDQISDTIIWVHYRHFRNYLLSKYNLTYELYYRIVIYGVTKDIQMRNLFGEYKRAKILKIGRRDEISKIEYLIKLGLNSTEYLEYGNLRDFRKLYIDSTSQDVMVTGVHNT